MQVSNQISPQIIAGAVGLLQPFVPDLSTQSLIAALKNTSGTSGEKKPAVGEFLTINQAAKVLQISRPTLYRLIKAGKLPLIKASQRLSRIPADAVNAYLTGGGYAANSTVEG